MLDQLVGLLLLGLGIQSPMNLNVKGETTTNVLPANTDSATGATLTEEQREAKETQIREMKETAKKEREAYKESLKNTKEAFRATVEASRAAYKASLKNAREAFHEEVEAKREEIKDQLEAKREAFKEKLQTIRDEKKRELTQNIQERMTKLNTKRTDAMLQHLDKMSEILERILEKVEELKTAGKDTSHVESLVTTADAAIATAQEAVAAQAGESYVVTITTETGLRNAVATVRQTLEADLKATHEKVVVARKAVSSAISALATLRGEPEPEEIVK